MAKIKLDELEGVDMGMYYVNIVDEKESIREIGYLS
eukprot:CAMPEP_0202958752 /NCGR_PEP_ID=MMETSP1396-20130829/3017_1 /ASSEMBLY_ACC=CAM_ASM_000872 /TAXON_ID= /ORGANISM="Pseudokeronopsis sp., Strain Brazil" /LENGTH=35 /DNA_ID= /DNA_START= /DNA_END= /DNA_ORIENTATION=